MTFCEFSLPLKIIMYTKYIYMFLYVFLGVYYFIIKKKQENIELLKKILRILTIILIIYLIVFIILGFTNFKIKKCFYNSNPIKVTLSEKLTNTYKSNRTMETTDQYVKNITPDDSRKIIGGNEIKVYNQNTYPLSNYEFNFSNSTDSLTFKKSGTEIATLATVISSLPQGDDSNPTKIIEYLKYSDLDFKDSINMEQALSILSIKYSFSYRNITQNEIIGGLRKGGIVMAQVYGKNTSNIFTCSNSYIVIYNYDSSERFSVISVNDKNYDYICPVGTLGFGNLVRADINDRTFSYDDITYTSNNYYLLWR